MKRIVFLLACMPFQLSAADDYNNLLAQLDAYITTLPATHQFSPHDIFSLFLSPEEVERRCDILSDLYDALEHQQEPYFDQSTESVISQLIQNKIGFLYTCPDHGTTTLMHAAHKGHWDIVKAIVRYAPSSYLLAQNQDGHTFIHAFIQYIIHRNDGIIFDLNNGAVTSPHEIKLCFRELASIIASNPRAKDITLQDLLNKPDNDNDIISHIIMGSCPPIRCEMKTRPYTSNKRGYRSFKYHAALAYTLIKHGADFTKEDNNGASFFTTWIQELDTDYHQIQQESPFFLPYYRKEYCPQSPYVLSNRFALSYVRKIIHRFPSILDEKTSEGICFLDYATNEDLKKELKSAPTILPVPTLKQLEKRLLQHGSTTASHLLIPSFFALTHQRQINPQQAQLLARKPNIIVRQRENACPQSTQKIYDHQFNRLIRKPVISLKNVANESDEPVIKRQKINHEPIQHPFHDIRTHRRIDRPRLPRIQVNEN